MFVFIYFWGAFVIQNVCHVTNCGVFGQWYFGKRESVRSSLRSSMTTSFGSICFGSFIVAVIQTVEFALRSARSQAKQNGNPVAAIVYCMLECVVACIRDIIEAFTYFSYVQVAVRGLGFLDSAKATFALCTSKNIFALIGLCLVGNVIFMGGLMCGLVAGSAGFATSLQMSTKDEDHWVLGMFALFVGLSMSFSVLSILRSGFATLAVCWAESDTQLQSLQPSLHNSFSQHAVLREA